MEKQRGGFWTSLPGVLAGIASLITAVLALLAFLGVKVVPTVPGLPDASTKLSATELAIPPAQTNDDKLRAAPSVPAQRHASQVEPPAPSKVDPALVGMWDQMVPMPAGLTRWEISIGGEGAFTFRSEGPGATPSYVGRFTTSGGRWTLSAPTINWFDGGAYQLPTPDTFVMQGKLGTGVWKKIS